MMIFQRVYLITVCSYLASTVQSVEGDEQVASIDTIEVTGYEEDAIPPHTGFCYEELSL